LVNPNDQSIFVTATLRKSDGTEVDQSIVELEPGEQFLDLISNVFTIPSSVFTGSVHFVCDQGFGAAAYVSYCNGSIQMLGCFALP
jgi:hypothetical protein